MIREKDTREAVQPLGDSPRPNPPGWKGIMMDDQKRITDLTEKIIGLEFILTEIVDSPHGAWNNDPLIYRENVIEWCQDRAKEGLEIIRGSKPTTEASK